MDQNHKLSSLFSNSVIYAFSNLLQRGLAFILLPLYALYFSKSEFGAMDQVYQMVMVLSLITSLGMPQGLVRGFYLDANSEVEQGKMLGALVAFLLPVTACIAVFLWVFSDPLSRVLFRQEGYGMWIKLSVGFYIAVLLQQLPMQLLKTRQQADRYAIWSIATFLLIAAGNLYFIKFLNLGLQGMIIANILGFGLTGIYLSYGMLRQIKWNADFSRLAPLIAFGLPMLPALLARKILEVSDRYIIPYYHGLDELGVYVMGARVSNIMDVVLLVPFLYAWQPFLYSQSDNPEAPKIFARVTHYMFMVLCLLFLLISISQGWILSVLGNDSYSEAAGVITWLVLSVLFNGLQYCISAGIHLRKKLTWEVMIMIAAAALNIVLNLMLIPAYKGVGAAMATAAAYLFYLVGTFILAQKNYPVPYNKMRFVNVAVQTALAFILLGKAETLILKSAVFVGYVITCPLLDLIINGEFRVLLGYRPSFFKKEAAEAEVMQEYL